MARAHLEDEEYEPSPFVYVKWSLAILFGLILGAVFGVVIALSTGMVEITC